jgi:hypothetical protein
MIYCFCIHDRYCRVFFFYMTPQVERRIGIIERDPSPVSFYETVVSINARYTLGLTDKTFDMVRVGGQILRDTHDEAHGEQHLTRMAKTTAILLDQSPELLTAINWNHYFCEVAFHDVGRASLPPGVVNAFVGHYMEFTIDKKPAVSYMKDHGFSQEDIQIISNDIFLHTFMPNHVIRTLYPPSTAGLLLWDTDTLDMIHPDRIEEAFTYIRTIVGEHVVKPLLNTLISMYTKATDYPYHFDGAKRIAQDRRKQMLEELEVFKLRYYDI